MTEPASPLGEPTPLPPAIELPDAIRHKLNDFSLAARSHGYKLDPVSEERMIAARAALSTEIGKLLEDAARLDWLEAHPTAHFDAEDDDVVVGILHGSINDREYSECGKGNTAREAIDAARRSTPSETPQ